RVLQGDPDDFRRIDDARAQHIDILLVLGVVAVGLRLVFENLADDDRTLDAGVLDDLAGRRLERPQHDVDAGLHVGILTVELADGGLGAQERNPSARNDAFLDRGFGRIHRVVDAVLLLLDFDLGRAADADHRHAARELGETLLQLLLVIVRGRVLDLRLDLRDTGFDVGPLPGAVDDRGVVLLDAYPLGAAEHLERDVLELDPEVLGDQRAAAEDGDVFKHG